MYNTYFTEDLFSKEGYITYLPDECVFVFGSNLAGRHDGGAAKAALNHFGAIYGQGEGLQGQSYAIPTMQGGPDTIKPYVDRFIAFARKHPELTFAVTEIGCGIAKQPLGEMARLFKDALMMTNVILPKSFFFCLAAEMHNDAKKETRLVISEDFIPFSELGDLKPVTLMGDDFPVYDVIRKGNKVGLFRPSDTRVYGEVAYGESSLGPIFGYDEVRVSLFWYKSGRDFALGFCGYAAVREDAKWSVIALDKYGCASFICEGDSLEAVNLYVARVSGLRNIVWLDPCPVSLP